MDCNELTKLGMSLWLPNTDDGEEGDAKGREEGDELPEAVQKVLALAAKNDDGDGQDLVGVPGAHAVNFHDE